MSKVGNVSFCSICDSAFETRKQFIKHNLSDEHINRAIEEMEDETMERVYDSEYYFLRPKNKTKPKTEPKDQKLIPKILLKPNPVLKPKLKPKIISIPELSLNVKKVMQNL